MDLSNKTIEQIFYEQIRNLTAKTRIQSFDLQFSDGWL